LACQHYQVGIADEWPRIDQPSVGLLDDLLCLARQHEQHPALTRSVDQCRTRNVDKVHCMQLFAFTSS
jgi:hypothetical protein